MIENFVPSSLLVEISGLFLFLFALVGAFDGIYFHLIKFKLHLNPESRIEHGIHTLRAFLLAPIVYFLFSQNSQGLSLLIGIGFIALDFLAEIFDVLVEKKSRENIGGISPLESMVHIAATSFRTVAIALVLISKPLEAYSLEPFPPLENYPLLLSSFAKLFAFTSLAGGILSTKLIPKKAPLYHPGRGALKTSMQ